MELNIHLIILKEKDQQWFPTNIFFKNDDDLYELNISKAIQYIKVIQKIKKIDEQIINERKLNKKNF